MYGELQVSSARAMPPSVSRSNAPSQAPERKGDGCFMTHLGSLLSALLYRGGMRAALAACAGERAGQKVPAMENDRRPEASGEPNRRMLLTISGAAPLRGAMNPSSS